MKGLKSLLDSKKALQSLLGSAIVGGCLYFGVDVEKALAVVSPLLTYVLGQSAVDAVNAVKLLKK